jgi:heme exporter protein A
MLRTLLGEHLAAGGMIVAATHQPLGIDAREMRIGPARPAPAESA